MAKQTITHRGADLRDEILGKGSPMPRTADVVEHFFEIAGGSRAVAQMIFDEYSKKSCSPMVRSRIVGLLLSALQTSEKQNEFRLDSLENLDKGDLDRLLEQKLLEIIGGQEDPDNPDRQPGDPVGGDPPAGGEGPAPAQEHRDGPPSGGD